MNRLKFTLLVFAFIGVGCGQIGVSAEQRGVQATREAEQYPWVFNPISEESKAALCQALELSADDDFCLEGTEIKHHDVFEKIKEVFPINQTTYDEVEAKLGNFPHSVQETLQPDGTSGGLWHVYQLTEYQEALIYFQIDLNDKKTIERIFPSGLGS